MDDWDSLKALGFSDLSETYGLLDGEEPLILLSSLLRCLRRRLSVKSKQDFEFQILLES